MPPQIRTVYLFHRRAQVIFILPQSIYSYNFSKNMGATLGYKFVRK